MYNNYFNLIGNATRFLLAIGLLTLFFPSFAFASCPGGSAPSSQTVVSGASGAVWGSGPFTTDSNLSTVAAFLGAPNGSSVFLNITDLGCISNFTGSTQNGVTTYGYSSWRGMNISASAPSSPTPTPSCPGGSAPSSQTVVSGVSGAVWGSGPFTTDSNLSTVAAFLGAPIGSNATLTITDLGCISNFTGSTQNGVTTYGYSSWRGMNINASFSSPAPTLSFTANPTSVLSGTASTLSWSTTDATSCTASGAWSGAKSIGNPSPASQSTGNLTSAQTYTLSCTGAGGTVNQSVTVNVTASPAPTLSFTANPTSVPSGTASTLSWSTANATSCTASGDWSGSKAPGAVSESTGNLTSSKTYTLECTGSGGTVSKSVTVNINAVTPAPTLSFTASQTSILSGGYSTLTWSSDASSCTLSAPGIASINVLPSGSKVVGPLTSTKTYTLECI